MTRQEISRRYQIPLDVLLEYEEWALCGADKRMGDDWQYDDSDLERLSMVMTLLEIGFRVREAEVYLRLALEGEHSGAQRLRMLEERRSELAECLEQRDRLYEQYAAGYARYLKESESE